MRNTDIDEGSDIWKELNIEFREKEKHHGVMYLGNIVNGKASGLCVIVNQNHRYLTGFNDQRHTDTILFKGQIKNQHFENFCSLQTTSFGYCGDYKKGVRHGLGSLKYSNGSNYLGKFDNGSFHGFGYYKDTISNFQYWG